MRTRLSSHPLQFFIYHDFFEIIISGLIALFSSKNVFIQKLIVSLSICPSAPLKQSGQRPMAAGQWPSASSIAQLEIVTVQLKGSPTPSSAAALIRLMGTPFFFLFSFWIPLALFWAPARNAIYEPPHQIEPLVPSLSCIFPSRVFVSQDAFCVAACCFATPSIGRGSRWRPTFAFIWFLFLLSLSLSCYGKAI